MDSYTRTDNIFLEYPVLGNSPKNFVNLHMPGLSIHEKINIHVGEFKRQNVSQIPAKIYKTSNDNIVGNGKA